MNPIFDVRIDEIIDKRRSHRGVAIAVLVYHKVSLNSCNVYVKEFPVGFLPNLLMNKEISTKILLVGTIARNYSGSMRFLGRTNETN